MVHAGTALVDPYAIFNTIALSTGMRVADLGCGRTGHFVFPSAKVVGNKGIVYAVDVMKSVLENIRSMARSEGYDNIQIVWSDIELPGKTPIPDQALDACFFVNVLFQLRNRAAAVKEAARLLKRDGYLVVVDWAKKLGMLGPDPEQMVTPDSVIALAKNEKLRLVKNCPAGDYHYALIFQKV